jgi:hypothetical protein
MVRPPPSTKEYRRALYVWYAGKLAMGTQLTLPGYPALRYDVRGDGPWFRWVATDEIIKDVEARTGYRVSMTLFNKTWRITTKQTHRAKFRAYWPISKGVHRMEWRQFVRFDGIGDCRKLAFDHSCTYNEGVDTHPLGVV